MKKIIFFLVFVFSVSSQAQQRPKLVVGIVVDQMKMEYLYRFSDDFSPNGFKRLMNNGYVFQNMHYNYMPTYTAPGHASIYTGTTPSTHGAGWTTVRPMSMADSRCSQAISATPTACGKPCGDAKRSSIWRPS